MTATRRTPHFEATHRLRRLQAGLLRPGDVPHRDRGRRARRRARDRGAERGRGRAEHVGRRGLKTQQGRQVVAAARTGGFRSALANASMPPTDDIKVRQAIQAVLDMDEIMDAATDGNYQAQLRLRLSPISPTTSRPARTPIIRRTRPRPRSCCQEAGYKGQPIVLLTNKDYSSMYNAALVVQQAVESRRGQCRDQGRGLADLGADVSLKAD